MELEEHLFRREAGRLVAILTRLFGVHNLALAEDVVQDAFCQALETWKFHGVPKNPSAWLLTTARNRALDVLRREGTASRFAPELARYLESEWTLAPIVDEAFDANGIADSQLRMMFSCIHPRLSEETRVALVLHLLGGFGMSETAAAFLKNESAMRRKLLRAKRTIARSRALFEVSGPQDLAARLPAVQRALYLLFNEGYHGASPEAAVRAELCREARRLTALLLDNAQTATPATHALAALLSFLAARVGARTDQDGNLLLLVDQDRRRWNSDLMAEGRRHLDLSATGTEVTSYHVEAAIAAAHADARSLEDTDWPAIVALYETLMRIQPSPVVALNRAVAVAMLEGPARGLTALEGIRGRQRLARYPFYFAVTGELAMQLGQSRRAREAFGRAVALARNPAERRLLERRLEEVRSVAGKARRGRSAG